MTLCPETREVITPSHLAGGMDIADPEEKSSSSFGMYFKKDLCSESKEETCPLLMVDTHNNRNDEKKHTTHLEQNSDDKKKLVCRFGEKSIFRFQFGG